jgi:predicted metal-dependent hydrolase
MSHKSQKIARLIETLRGRDLDAHYLGFFECFNQEQFFEAHEVLEELWLPQRGGPQDRFYKGLIQLAGAFVHVQKNRLQPACALLRLARGNLEIYPTPHERLDIAGVLSTIDSFLAVLSAAEPGAGACLQVRLPKLALVPGAR